MWRYPNCGHVAALVLADTRNAGHVQLGCMCASVLVEKGNWLGQGDLLLLAAGEAATVHKALDRVRQYVAAQLGEVDASKHALLWVTGKPALAMSGRHSLQCCCS